MSYGRLRQASKARIISVDFLASVVVLGRAERWCARCGETMMIGSNCPRCDGSVAIDPKQILRPGEYVVM